MQKTSIEIFDKAKAIMSLVERCKFVEEACGNDVSLRVKAAKVSLLLKSFDEDNSILDADVRQTILHTPFDPNMPDQIGPYHLADFLGEGGFGQVFLAEQTSPVRRHVALKRIKPGMYSREVISRFNAERQALAIMDHPTLRRCMTEGRPNMDSPTL